MHAIRMIALSAVLSGAAATASDEQPKYAATASKVGNAILTGTDVTSIEGMPLLSPAELAELGRLAGCAAKVQPGGTQFLVVIHWHCESNTESATHFTRATTMRFNPQGELFNFAINPLEANFAPTETALNAEDLPSERSLANSFAKAARNGSDPTLEGLIGLTDLQAEQLKSAQGHNSRVYPPISETEMRRIHARMGRKYTPAEPSALKYTIIWEDGGPGKIGDLTADLYFDDDGRPIGVIIERAIIRTQAVR